MTTGLVMWTIHSQLAVYNELSDWSYCSPHSYKPSDLINQWHVNALTNQLNYFMSIYAYNAYNNTAVSNIHVDCSKQYFTNKFTGGMYFTTTKKPSWKQSLHISNKCRIIIYKLCAWHTSQIWVPIAAYPLFWRLGEFMLILPYQRWSLVLHDYAVGQQKSKWDNL